MITDEYLNKIRFAIRRNSNPMVDEELKDIIEQCQADMVRVGVPKEVAIDENDKLVLGCQRAFARWQFGIDGDDAIRNKEDYECMVDGLRKRGENNVLF